MTTESTSETIGFIGLGLMGHGMAKNIVDKGYPLTVYARSDSAAVADLQPASCVFILTHNHQHDLRITEACLQRLRRSHDLGLVGLIGSATKRASFAHRLQDRGFGADEFARITCPIGVPGIRGKEPEVIAIAVAAQLLQHLSCQK